MRPVNSGLFNEVNKLYDHIAAEVPKGVLGYAQVIAPQSGITTETNLTGLSVTVTVGTNRYVRVTASAFTTRTVADGFVLGAIYEDATYVGSFAWNNLAYSDRHDASVVLTPTAGAHTYKLTLMRSDGTGTVGIDAGAGDPAYILVEDLGPV